MINNEWVLNFYLLKQNNCIITCFSLDKLYGADEVRPAQQLDSQFSGHIPMNELKKTYSSSSGPGGQNVNKVATKVDLR